MSCCRIHERSGIGENLSGLKAKMRFCAGDNAPCVIGAMYGQMGPRDFGVGHSCPDALKPYEV